MDYLKYAECLTEMCYKMYSLTNPTKLAGEFVTFNKKTGIKIGNAIKLVFIKTGNC